MRYTQPGMSTEQNPPGKAMWCETHQRPLGPDGRCILCVGNEEPTRTERRVVYVVLGLVLLGGAIPAAYVLLQDPPWREDAVSPSPAPRTAAPRPAPRLAPRARLAP